MGALLGWLHERNWRWMKSSRRPRSEDAFKPPNQIGAVRPEAGVRDVKCISPRQLLDRCRKLVDARHKGSVDEDGYHTDLASKRRLDLKTYEIIWVAQSAVTFCVYHRQPVLANDNQYHLALLKYSFEFELEIQTKLD
jgi:hypothetical protein